MSILEKEGKKLLHFGSKGLNFNRPVELQLTVTIASLLQKKEIIRYKKWGFVKSVGDTDETDDSESVQFPSPNGLKIYADKLIQTITEFESLYLTRSSKLPFTRLVMIYEFTESRRATLKLAI